MDKLKMTTADKVDVNIEKIEILFPNCVTERVDESGNVEKAIDFDMLKQELSHVVVDGAQERYQFTWPDKKKSILLANAPINKTLRPCKSESVGRNGEAGKFDSENLYIEGDNLDVLKLLQETYLGKVKMIYIDPPYNTGNDFVYEDDFSMRNAEFAMLNEDVDEDGNRMVLNAESNGRFHTDWLNMIYPRLKLAKDLLTDDGVIFISVDDNEVQNMRKICDEIFGEKNFVMSFIRKTVSQRAMAKYSNTQHEYCLCFAKQIEQINLIGEEKKFSNYNNTDNDPNGEWQIANPSISGSKNTYGIENPYTGKVDYPPIGRGWGFKEHQIENLIETGKFVFLKNHKENQRGFIIKSYKKDIRSETSLVNSLDMCNNDFMNQVATKELVKLFNEKIFDYSKPVSLLKKIVHYITLKSNDIVLDFFSGSATTAHAVMQLNAEDGGNRKFIMVQLPEVTDEKSEAYKAGYKNICEIGKERIRRAGKKILENTQNANKETKQENMFAEQKQQSSISSTLDIGFRVLKLDTSNMKDVYYRAENYSQSLLDTLEGNIKADRTPQDLLLQVMLDMGVMLSSKIEERKFAMQNGQCVMVNAQGATIDEQNCSNLTTIYIVGDYSANIQPNLIACFDDNLSNEVVTAIAKMKPLYAVFRDSSFANDSVATNFEQIFSTYSPTTTRKVI